MRIGKVITVALSAGALTAAPMAAQAAGSAPSVPARVASPAEDAEHFSRNTMLVVALLALTVGVIFLVKGHPHTPASP